MKDNFEYALQFAMNKHKGQLDKGWTPYIQHLLGVWAQVRHEDLITQIAALLHDTVEDTETIFEELEKEFGTEVMEIIRILTRNRWMPYDAYIESIVASGNERALRVKMADLEDNSSPMRLQRLPEQSKEYFERRAKNVYGPAKLRISDALYEIQRNRHNAHGS